MSTSTSAALRRQFALPEDDVDALDAWGLVWETAVIDGVQWLFLTDFPVPDGFNVSRVTLAVRIIPGYPAAALDMLYVLPAIVRADGKAIPALTLTSIEGRTFQQWSRHYTAEHPWRPDVDNVSSHLRAGEEWFRKALR
ncbi:MAG: hypothetical protein JWM41_2045 [Gemmatimonadetes bacterium]|nr:hypothetical protein [Gemmatimonadota bacterium]